jgi:cytochrome c oxidase assembly protein subunit 11
MSEEKGNSRSLLRVALIVCACTFLFGFALVPIYRIACVHVFGIKLDNAAATQAKVDALKEDDTRLITVQFLGTVNSKLDWDFAPEVTTMKVHPGKLTEAWFDATNKEPTAIVGNAVPSVAPNVASLYFNKTECFCFTEQMLKSGESRRMPVRFIIDPKLPQNIATITLSYTFYNNELATKKVVEHVAPVLTPAS